MGILRNSIGLCFGLALTLSPGLAAERVLLDPDWNSPDVARAQKALEAQRAANASPDVRRDAELPLSLPRWGLSGRIDQPTSEEQSRSRAGLLSGSIPAWPSCAKPAADPKPVTDASGLWYTDTYDYGCVVISISGDRSAKPDQDFPADARPPDECADQSGLDSTETDTGDLQRKVAELTGAPTTAPAVQDDSSLQTSVLSLQRALQLTNQMFDSQRELCKLNQAILQAKPKLEHKV